MQSAVNLITCLPAHLSIGLLRDWLTIGGLCRTDSAFCNKGNRAYLLDVLSSKSFVLCKRLTLSNKSCLRWLLLRKVRVKNFRIANSCDRTALRSYLRFAASEVRDVTFVRKQFSIDIQLLSTYCHNLTTLRLELKDGNDSIGTELVDLLWKNPNLIMLRMWNVILLHINLDGLQSPDVRILEVSGCHLPLPFLSSLRTTVAPQIEEFSLDGCGIDNNNVGELHALFGSMSKLRGLDLVACEFVTDELLTIVTNTSLGLEGIDLSDCGLITNNSISNIGQRISKLSHLNIQKCPLLTDGCLLSLRLLCATTLSCIFLSVDQYTVANVAALMGKCAQMKFVGLTGTRSYSDEEMQVLFQSIPRVTSLCLQGSFACDEALQAVAQNCTQLQAFCVPIPWGESPYKAHSLLSVLKSCPKLRFLCVQKESIDEMSMLLLQQLYPKLSMEPQRKIFFNALVRK